MDEAAIPNSETLARALEYAAFGWPVLPCYGVVDGRCACGAPDCASPGKHPLTRQGLHDASTDPRVVERWWRGRVRAVNVGLRTGAASGLVVVDIDPGHGGQESLARLAARYGELPETLAVATGGGGRHLYFEHPGSSVRNSAGTRLGPGLDVRGDGGYVLAPPSVHLSGERYVWTRSVRLRPLPAWLLALVTREPRPARLPPRPAGAGAIAVADAWAQAALRGERARVMTAPVGQRNHSLNRAAFALGQIVAAGFLQEAAVVEALVGAALTAGLTEREAQATVASGLGAGARFPRHPGPRRGTDTARKGRGPDLVVLPGGQAGGPARRGGRGPGRRRPPDRGADPPGPAVA